MGALGQKAPTWSAGCAGVLRGGAGAGGGGMRARETAGRRVGDAGDVLGERGGRDIRAGGGVARRWGAMGAMRSKRRPPTLVVGGGAGAGGGGMRARKTAGRLVGDAGDVLGSAVDGHPRGGRRGEARGGHDGTMRSKKAPAPARGRRGAGAGARRNARAERRVGGCGTRGTCWGSAGARHPCAGGGVGRACGAAG